MRSVVRAVRRRAQTYVDGGKNLPQRHQLPGRARRSKYKKPIFYWVFPDGTALADQPMWK
jgi:hypothetical protein